MPENMVDVQLHYIKSTGTPPNGTHVYGEKTSGQPPKIKSLYLPRWVFPSGNEQPDSLHVTVSIPE